MAKSFPERRGPASHAPEGEKSHYVKRSEHVGRGHTDNSDRLSPIGEFPNSGSGEGMDNMPAPAGIPHKYNE